MNSKTIIILAVLLMAILSSGCVPVAKVYVCGDGKQVSDLSQCTPVKTETKTETSPNDGKSTQPEVVPKDVPIKFLSDEAKTLFDKSANVKNVKFNYFRSDDAFTKNRYFVSRDKMKVELTVKDKFSPTEAYDTVYLDLQDKTATAHCERQSVEICGDSTKVFTVDYDDYYIATPFTWMDMVEEADLTGRSKQIDGRQAREVTFSSYGKKGTLWVDSYFGVPLTLDFDGITYNFANTLINDAKDVDFSFQAQN